MPVTQAKRMARRAVEARSIAKRHGTIAIQASGQMSKSAQARNQRTPDATLTASQRARSNRGGPAISGAAFRGSGRFGFFLPIGPMGDDELEGAGEDGEGRRQRPGRLAVD